MVFMFFHFIFQVSHGEMIGCDNDLCPIEWFHFNCVQLSRKPRGRWYCPRCRGDKQTVMKPRAQFLEELAIFNKEREAANKRMVKVPKDTSEYQAAWIMDEQTKDEIDDKFGNNLRKIQLV